MTRPSFAHASTGRAALLWVLAGVLALVAIQRLTDGFSQLVWAPTRPMDLGIRWGEVQHWFAGQPVYTDGFAVYPPASYPIPWPLLGWVDFTQARWLWGVTTVGALAWLASIVARESGAASGAGRIVTGLLPLAVYPARAVMVNGQLALHLLPPLLTGLLLLTRRPPSWGRDHGSAALLVVALTKPSLTAPFMWIVLTARGALRPMALVVLGYAALTALATVFQPMSPVALLGQFAGGAVHDAVRVSPKSHANLHSWIDVLGLGRGYTVASLAALLALGWWTWSRGPGADPWVRLGIAALVARFWTFHYRYDDLLVLVSVVALMRIVNRAPLDRGAAVMLALLTATLLMPARLFFPPAPWQAVEAVQTVVWLAALGYLVHRARPAPGG